MKQDMNHTFVKAHRTVFVAAMMLLTGTIALAQTQQTGVRIYGNVYGGGNAADVGKAVTVNISAGTIEHDVYGGGAKANTNVDDPNDIYSVAIKEGESVVGYYTDAQCNTAATGTAASDGTYYRKNVTTVNMTGGTVSGDVYGGGLGSLAVGTEGQDGYVAPVAANVDGAVTVNVKGGTARNVFGCNNHYGSPQDNVIVNIAGGTVNNNVFGGGQEADALGQITVNVTGGTVTNDVYGGGALADTNTANWNATNSKFLFFEVTGLTVGTSPVTGYYTKTGDDYTLITASDAKAEDGKTYYSHYTTTVNLTGGTIGNAYGGALGSTEKAANVWGDVYLTVDGTAFTISNDSYTEGTGDNVTTVQVPKSGRVFGCNNINGTPKREVTVHVKRTVPSAGGDHTLGIYEIAAVYGGGNMAPYEPTKAESESTDDGDFASDDTKASTNVIIDGCNDTSIETVYGGGNAASTPSTKVTVNGAFEIGELFGGGNGKDKIKNGSDWEDNPGAHVGFKAYAKNATEAQKAAAKYGSGQARVNIYGGKIHAVYGGSNTLGNVRRVAVAMLDEVVSTCPIDVDEAYGGGKSADMDGKAILNLGCIPGIGSVYGGSRAAKVNNDVELTITNGTYTNVFGGNNERNVINGKITVNIEETGCRPIRITNLYGGGNLAAYPGSGATIADPSVTLNVKSFTEIGNIYGGGYGEGADVTSDVTVNINEVKGRWSQANTPTPTNTYNETGASNLGVIGNVYGGGYGADVIGDVEINIGTEETVEFKNTPTNLTAYSQGKYTVEGANITGSVYGGGFGAATTVTGNVVVNVGGQKTEGTTTTFIGGDIAIGGSVYGGSALGAVNATKSGTTLSLTEGKTTAVTLCKGNVTGAVFGGGQGNSNTTAHVYGKSTVTLYGDVVAGGLYGGCDANGEMHDGAELNLFGGTVGTTLGDTDPIPNMVFGGGLGQATKVDGNVTVNVGSKDYTGNTSVTIWGNVYGGGALGDVNLPKNTSDTNTYTTLVNLYKGTVKGNVFGGGLGQAAVGAQSAVLYTNVDEYNTDKGTSLTAGDFAALTGEQKIKTPAVEAKDAIAAGVKGKVRVDLNGYDGIVTNSSATDYDEAAFGSCIVTGSIFGCNNTKGSPEDDVEVHIYKTVGWTDDKGTADTDDDVSHVRTDDVENTTEADRTYELTAVYGGGNKAAYTTSGKTAKVYIETCDVSIYEVYGGGYGADVPNTSVDVKGAYEIGTVFGGGYGASTTDYTNPGANVNGSTEVLLKGGVVHEVYGGSNTKGNIKVGSNVNVSDGSGCCVLKVDNIYGGGKNASMEGGTSIVLGCQPNSWIEDIYAGSREADVDGNVKLTITSGKFKRVFGGNKTSGKLKGSITVNIEETGSCSTPIIIGELYAGGNEADYSIYGYKDNGDPMTADELREKLTTDNPGMTTAEIDALFQTTKKKDPQLNVLAFTSIGAIYGGGYSAKMYANPHVDINVVNGSHSDDVLVEGFTPALADVTPATTLPYPAHASGAIGAIGNVFGGGNLATVYGSTTVNIGTETTVGFVTEPAHYRPSTAPDTPLTKNTETGLYDITVEGAIITGNVYGGGKLADVTGNTYVNICAKNGAAVAEGAAKVTIGTNGVTDADHGNVFGGGKGEAAAGGTAGAFECAKAMVGVDDNQNVIDNGENANPRYTLRDGGTTVVIGNGTIYGTVYGGGEVGRVERNTVVTIGIGDGNTQTSKPSIKGSVYGAGKGVETHGYSALVRGKTTVTIKGDAKVEGTVYGGGDIASVGRYNIADADYHAQHTDVPIGMPYSLKYPSSESGNCYVTIGGYAEIGLNNMQMPTFSGHVFGAGKGILPHEYPYSGSNKAYTGDKPQRVQPDDFWETFTTEPAYITFIETLGMTGRTFVTIEDHAFVKGSVYGGSENGHVLNDTKVTIDGDCQIGIGAGKDSRYTDWTATSLDECAHWPYGKEVGNKKLYLPYDVYDLDGTTPKAASDGHTFYGNVFGGGSGYFPYRKNPAWEINEAKTAEVGQPVDENGYSDGIWLRSAGAVYGNTVVDIKGGHILTSVYGGNECTDVGKYPTGSTIPEEGTGTCTVNIVGGTVGVPRTLSEMKAHPVTCYVFGAGKGDQRINFNTWTNVASTQVNISGTARIYGSTFGGGEDGHIIGDAETNIGGTVRITNADGTTEDKAYSNVLIGTTGTSYVDGNVFGGGRGFSGDAQTAGTVGGNVRINISKGTMLGSVYGGGRLASVGTMFEFPTLTDGSTNPAYGQFKEDGGGKTYGHITINISGGTIGNENANGDGAQYSGNVFGGSMGRLTLLNGDTNPIWPKMAQVKETNVNIYGTAVVRRSVYGGGELGTVRDNAYVTIGGYKTADADNDGYVEVTSSNSDSPTIRRDVYGGGYGSEDMNYTIFTIPELKSATADPTKPESYETHTYAYTPMQFAGCVGKNTYVNVAGGYIRKSVYGGGEMASVGVIDYRASTTKPAANEVTIGPINGTTYYYDNMVKHGDPATGFALSWPYKFNYVDGYPGATHVKVTGGRLGLKTGDTDTGFDDNGDVYGAGKGKAGDFKDYLFCANVGSTDVKIAYGSTPTAYSGTGDLIAGAVYGGGEDGHVMGNTKLTISGGLIYHSVYGGGSGKGLYNGSLLKIGATEESATASDYYNREVYSITAGKVFGNTEVNMSGGYVVRNIYGGGNMGSVGKGNYAGGTDDYSTDGYGEKVANLWSNTDFTGSGKCKVTITGGTIGYIASDPTESMYPKNSTASLPYGNVFGGCRGEAAPDFDVTPSYLYSPEFFMGYVNETIVEIGKADGTGPTILGSVYGGGMDGHVRRDASVTIKGGEIGKTFDATSILGNNPDNIQWLARGNVYGAGSGIGEYNASNIQYSGSYSGTQLTGTGNSTSAGSVTRFTKVDIQGGTIYRNVYGGGSLASVGAPKIDQDYEEYRKGDTAEGHSQGKQTLNEVVISGGNIGGDYSYNAGNYVYGGRVFGGSRGDATLDATKFSTSMFTSVTINANADDDTKPAIAGSVFGGGEVGIVKGSVDVTMNGGIVNHDVYGGGALANTNTETSSNVPYTTTVNLYGGMIKGDAYGGGLGQKDGFNGKSGDIPAVVYGDIAVTLNGTAFDINYYEDEGYTNVVKSGRVFGCNNLLGSPQGNVTVTVNKTVSLNTDGTVKVKPTKKSNTYELAAVYGGGNLAPYSATGEKTHVIIHGCSDTSIETVYGGGNAAAVPETAVDIYSAYEIGALFGGGNGKDKYKNDSGWQTNAGANVNGNTNTLIYGGTVHEAYGGSNEKGTITGNVSIDVAETNPESCTLDVDKLVGAGKNADVNGDLIMIMGCKPSTKIPLLFAGADNANVKGNVELTITSGNFGKVFGGNNDGGAIFGHIKLNIEETGGCDTPITIDELYLGGNMASYSQYGYYNSGTTDAPVYQPRTSASDSNVAVNFGDGSENDHTKAPYAQPELNVVSCTYIGKVFGGGYGTGATLYGDPIVNINMIPGSKANDVPTFMTTDTRLTALNLKAVDNPNKLGVIGDVFGGGNAANIIGNTTVNIGMETKVQCHESYDKSTIDDTHDGYTYSAAQNVLGAYITGNVFGGGNFADVSGNTYVNICGTQEPDSNSENGYNDTSVSHPETEGFAVSIGNSVYGGGSDADVLGNTFVTMADGYVFNGIFGGGLAGSVGTFTRDPNVTVFGHTANHEGCIGKPTECTAGGTCYVVVSGGQIGPIEVATQGMNRTAANGGPVPQGWVWGGGCGIVEDPVDHPDTHFKAYVNHTDVTIKDNAFILESIIGGGEFGRVRGNTLVKIKGGQIGVGEGKVVNGKPVRYTDAQFIDPTSTTITTENALATCSHFPFGKNIGTAEAPNWVYKAYDPHADDAPNLYPGGSTDDASDGKTWIGCVFAGGSGYMPVVKAKSGNTVTDYDWISSAGWVEGNAEVRISGGHILTNVYGGNEVTSVQGTSTVRMSGGTIGVPRTKEQIEALPMTGYLFGAGKGDPRAHFGTYTNVQDVVIEITGGIIYGSVYGGSEDGHVLGNVTIGISDGTGYTIGSNTYDKPIIGTCGTSYFDGNVFGGGRGFSGDNLNAGSVGGTVTMNITGGTMLGSVYGGGRLGSVNDDITIAISGGTIGNSHEYAYDAAHELTHTKGGNVFAGGMGRMYQLDGTTPISAVNWWKLGSAKSTKVTVSDDAVIKSCVYGGGELGQVVGTHASKNAQNENVNVGTEVIISGGTIGTEIKDGETVKYTFGSVFGGGYGSLEEKLTHNEGTASESVSYPKYIAGRVKGGTKVNMTDGAVLASVYGGGEMAAVGESTGLGETLTDGLTGDTHVIISGGTVGESGFGGAKMGNVYGGGSGHNNTVRSGHVYGNTNVTISNGTIYHNIYGGGAYGSVGEFVYETTMVSGAPKVSGITGLSTDHTNTGVATVTITGGTIGVNGKENGMVFGSSRGDINKPGERDDHTAWVYNANVTIGTQGATTGPAIKGSLYGSGENGHTFNDAVVTVYSGTIGIADRSDPGYTVTSNGTEYSGAAYLYRGNVYGGGCGTDKYYQNHAQETHDGNGQLYNPLAGIVYGNATVNINGGRVVRNVYGAGAMGSVGKVVSTTTEGVTTTTFTGGQTAINISGGTIGVSGTVGDGNVFGAARGALDAAGNNLALVAEKTRVSITGGTMYGNVYGGGELGYVGKFASETNTTTGSKTYSWPTNSGLCNVTINGASAIVKGHVFGAGKGSSDTYECEPAMVYSTKVDISNGTVDGNVYGGGQLGRVDNSTVVTIGTEGETEGTNKPDIKGDVFGAGAGVATHGYSALVRGNSTITVQGKANVGGSVYGGGETASVGKFKVVNSLPKEPLSGGTCTVVVNGGAAITGDVFGACKGVTPDFANNEGHWMSDNNNPHSFADEDDYLSFLKTLALTSNTNVTIGGSATVNGSVYGGGQRGITLGTVAVNMNGGTVVKDVYGGGALADTNTGNATDYGTDTESLTSTSTYTTTVNLMGGMIKGDAYGGGLGQLGTDPIPAKVYGNVAVNLGNATENVNEASATKFWIDNYTGAHADVVKSGRVFGCNNLNGTPLGNVTVTINRTVAGNVTRTSETAVANNKEIKKDNPDDYASVAGYVTPTYEVAAVYGGGNLAGYVPSPTVTGAKVKVLINSCDVSIDEVYGGGNAAPVPATDVEVMGAYEINQVFGGGNGKDEYTLNGTDWIENPGANIGGNTNTILRGGLIHEAYGGSNEKGEITGDIVIDTGSGGRCTLDVEKMVGAGKNADVNGNLIVVMGCKPETKIPLLYAGADNANVNGNVELTITSGNFGRVFGGNNEGGAIRGHIIVNIEETGTCETPITIDELYLGGNMAAYSRYGYYIKTNETVAGTGSGALGEHAVLTEGRLTFLPRTSADDTHKVVKTYNKADNTWEVYAEGEFTPYDEPVLNVVSCTSIGEVFGGGYGTGGDMYANPTVNINMIPGSHASGVPAVMTSKGLTASENPNNLGIIGNVYGGGNEADVIGDPTVNVGTASKVRLHLSYDKANENNGDNGYEMSDEQDVMGAYIIGDVFGGGKGKDDSYTCEKAMIGIDGDGEAHPDGGTTVNIYNGMVLGNVYGGGEIGRVEKNTVVTIGTGDGVAPGGTPTSAPVIKGSVFGGGKGKETHGYAALVRGNPTVTVQGNAKIGHNVYGGGEIASVARYKVAKTEAEAAANGVEVDMPYVLANNTSGNCVVRVLGYAEIGPDDMKMYHEGVAADRDKPDDYGHVFGAGKGILPGGEYDYVQGETKRMISVKDGEGNIIGSDWEYFADEAAYITFIQTLALASKTDVTIGNHAFVKGSVYGGSENGLVQFDTDVKINDDCQIGNGDGVNRRYTEGEWASESLTECAHWVYGLDTNNDGKKDLFAPYDPYANATGNLNTYSNGRSTEGGRRIATDGHTYYGNVFGGGSGSVPYFDAEEGVSKYLNSAGTVKGNTKVTISGGHILTNVYGGCEATNVQGTAKVIMTDGTIGVPRTDAQIIAHPVTGYLFGAGKGDQRIFFNKDTNVGDADVSVTGGRIYGSVYGGGEDGHVLKDVTMTIGKTDKTGPTIGSKGTSYYDGHVFGGGRGFGGEALTAGNVSGSVKMTVEGGKILGSVYGGGRMASVGYGLYLVDEEITVDGQTVKPYGTMRPDNMDDKGNAVSNFKRGYIDITINGGTIGNDDEYVFDSASKVTHTKGGNVFAGSMGSLYKQDGTTTNSQWAKFAHAKQTKVTIKGGTIKSCVYGGGELGAITDNTDIKIEGGTIGTEIGSDANRYYFGSVFGGGYGSTIEFLTDEQAVESNPKLDAGIIHGSTKVTMEDGKVMASVYGGGEVASVEGSTDMAISGGTIGVSGFGGIEIGNVYGGGKGDKNIVRAGHIFGNTKINISEAEGKTTQIWHNIYGGGAYGTVGDFDYETEHNEEFGTDKVTKVKGLKEGTTGGTAEVYISGGTIGRNGKENGMVFGSSRGDVGAPGSRDDLLAWTNDTKVEISGSAKIKGSVYGGGENGHNFRDAVVNIKGGTIGIAEGEAIDSYSGAAYPYRGNVYGGGCGTDMYDSDNDGVEDSYNPLAGIVYGDATVNINGGTVVRNVYGAGAMGSVGKTTTTEGGTTITGGTTTINISGGTIGVDGTAGEGNVFGAARGALDATGNNLALVAGNTKVSVTGGTMYGNVYGGGELGYVGKYTTVTENGSKTNTWPENTGLCEVTINGGSASVKGHVFGAGKGSATTFECEPAMVHSTNVSIIKGAVDGNVYGGGQLGRVENNTVVTIGDETSDPVINGYVFGAGAGVATHGYSALVRGNSTVTVQGKAKVGKSVYGGGETASVGRFKVVNSLPKEPLSGGNCTVAIQGSATIGASGEGYVFGACKGVEPDYANNAGHVINTGESKTFADEAEYLSFLKTLALTSNTKVTVDGNASVNGSVFGGGQRGITLGNVVVNMIGGTVVKDIYGGGALADTNTGNASDYGTSTESIGSTSTYTTAVNLTGGTIGGEAYGGGLGQKAGVNGETSDIEAVVYGDVLMELNKGVAEGAKGCVVDKIFGANNINGTPKGHVKVHVYSTQNKDLATIKDKKTITSEETTAADYDMAGVFGGGNAADYVPAETDTKQNAEVIIEGCGLTSIYEVYGGGYGAATPGTDVLINGTHIIDKVFGGGYGAGVDNPGANVGLRTDKTPYGIGVVDGTPVDEKTKIAIIQLKAGKVNSVFGGSNSLGDIRNGASITTLTTDDTTGETVDPCDILEVGELYGGGNEAVMEGGAEIVLRCMPDSWIGEVYAGARKADVGNDVSLTITSGKFEHVYGGNKSSGKIDGYVEVNIEECPTCGTPVIIGELYGGGNEAPYTLPESYGKDYQSPRVNVRAFTSIGTIYGGGKGEDAVVNGNPTVSINVGMVDGGGQDYAGETKSLDGNSVTLYPHEKNKIGVIGNVFGGGNAAKVNGSTTVLIGTESYVQINRIVAGETDLSNGDYYTRSRSGAGTEEDPYVYTYTKATGIAKENTVYYTPVIGVDIKGNVYGGGNNAGVTGNTNVTIGKEKVTTP